MNELKQELEAKLKTTYQEKSKIIEYIVKTLENFAFRYMETSLNQNIKAQIVSHDKILLESYEDNLGHAFKIQNSEIKNEIKNLAKSVDKNLKPRVKYKLELEVKNLSSESGTLVLTSTVNWNYPENLDTNNKYKQKNLIFTYNDIFELRKNLALKIEEVCDLFL
jgi:hypothetical protein